MVAGNSVLARFARCVRRLELLLETSFQREGMNGNVIDVDQVVAGREIIHYQVRGDVSSPIVSF